MPRRCRLDWPGAVHHVMARGVGKHPLFDDDQDMDVFTNRLVRCIQQTGTSIFAWVLMPNHLHLLTRTDGESLSKFMQKLLTGHAVYYNMRHERVGHLFQNRFKSILVQAEEYLLSLVRYIHLNPLRAGLVRFPDHLESYRWSGHRALIHPRSLQWINRKEVLDCFSGNESGKIDAYLEYLEEDKSDPEYLLTNGSFIVNSKGLVSTESSLPGPVNRSGFPLLGSREFGLSVLKQLRGSDAGSSRVRTPVHQVITSLVILIEDYWRIPAGSLRSGGRRDSIVEAREVLSYLLVDTIGLTFSDSGHIVGLSRQGVSDAAERFRVRMRSESSIYKQLLHHAYEIIGQ